MLNKCLQLCMSAGNPCAEIYNLLKPSLAKGFPARNKKSHGTVPLKGQSHKIFCTRFFPQTAPPCSIRDVLGPF